MNLKELQRYTISEEKSEEFNTQGIPERFDHCPRCEVTSLSNPARQVKELRKPGRANIQRECRVPRVRILNAIRFFKLDTSVRKTAHQFGRSYNTT